MIKRLLQKGIELSKIAVRGAIQGSGMGALYFCTSTLLAAILLAGYLTYAWNIDRERWYRAYAVLQGIELAELRQSEMDAAADISFERVLAERARRLRDDEFIWEVRQQSDSIGPPVPDTPPEPLEDPDDIARISEYERRLAADIARARSEGQANLTQLLERMDPDQAKEVIRRFWNDEGERRRVLQVLMDMEDRPRENILFAMQETNDEELRDLCDILLRIGDGEPMVSLIQEASR